MGESFRCSWPLVEKLPSDLVEIREGEVRLTPIGKVVLIYIV